VPPKIGTLTALRSAVSAVQQTERAAKAGPTSDEEACAKLSALEERVGGFEGLYTNTINASKWPRWC
jgi:hypothetical protein